MWLNRVGLDKLDMLYVEGGGSSRVGMNPGDNAPQSDLARQVRHAIRGGGGPSRVALN